MEKKLDDRKSRSAKDPEKMIFSLVFNGNCDNDNVPKKTGKGFSKIKTTPKCLEQSNKKLKLVKIMAKVINPFIYVLYVIFYFIYYIMFFSK